MCESTLIRGVDETSAEFLWALAGGVEAEYEVCRHDIDFCTAAGGVAANGDIKK